MAEFFIELFSEEMPSSLQISARKELLQIIINYLDSEQINYEKNYFAFSTPNRLVVYFKNIKKEVLKKPEEIKGPSINSPEIALNGFIKSNNTTKEKIYKKKINNQDFYFFKTKEKKIDTEKLLKTKLPDLLSKVKWKKSMRWGNHDLYWGRPLKSILAVFNNKKLLFNYYHLKSTDRTYLDKDYEEKLKTFKNFNSYIKYFRKMGVIINQNHRKDHIEKKLLNLSKSKNLKIKINEKLLTEVTNIVEKPNLIMCSFDEKFLKIPKEIIILTIENYQRYFPLYDQKNELTNKFLIVADCLDKKGFIKKGNENVIEARLADAEYFWKKNKSQSMLKQISSLKNVNYFNKLGNYYDKSQRLKKLSGLISDEFLISKEKIEIASSICKVDLLSDIVNEFPELQGILGGYFAEAQGFEKEVCLALKEQYLPTGFSSAVPKKSYSIALSLSDKIDTLVGFFGIGLMPTSSKDPYGLRRLTIGLIKIIIENKKNLRLKEIINYSILLYNDQFNNLINKNLYQDLSNFITERFKSFMKDKTIRYDIIESCTTNNDLDRLFVTYTKANTLNKVIDKQIGIDIIENYKRASNLLSSNSLTSNENISGSADPALFKEDAEKELYKKIHDIRKNLTSIKIENDYETQLSVLASIKNYVSLFFDKVTVEDKDDVLKKNRLELLKMLCMTFDSYVNFNKIELLQ